MVWLENKFKNVEINNKIFFIFRIIKNKNDSLIENDNDENTLMEMSNCFFAPDIELVKNYLKNKDHQTIEKYILANIDINRDKKINILDYKSEDTYQELKKILSPENSPLGKWFSKFSPAFMQQVAINLIINENASPIFSVNGPPGTGKTTLLTEIIVNSIIEKAKVFAELISPDDLFSTKQPQDQEWYKINNDIIIKNGIIVASCNNIAVENISKELPKLNEVIKTYFPNKNDRYFSYDDNVWGTISACLGKKANIKKFLEEILWPVLKNINAGKAINFNEAKDKFLAQLKIVNGNREDIINLSQQFIKNEEKYKKYEYILKMIDEFNNKKEIILKYKKEIGNCFQQLLHLKKTIKIKKEIRRQKIELKNNKKEIVLFTKKENKWKLKKCCSWNKFLNNLKEYLDNAKNINKEEYIKLNEKAKNKGVIPFNKNYYLNLQSEETQISTQAQVNNPWFNDEINKNRTKLFKSAIDLTKAFIYNSTCFRKNLAIIYKILSNNDNYKKDEKEKMFADVFNTLQILVPVISTTFASVSKMFKNVKEPESLGTLIIDEAGQAQPQMALGSIFRCKKTIVVGDPKQIEPIVTDELDIFKKNFNDECLKNYKGKEISVQSFADRINSYGTWIHQNEWIGCPLLVHRRCLNTMFNIANTISYDGIMKIQTNESEEEIKKTFLKKEYQGYWIDKEGKEKNKKNHYVEPQGEEVCGLLEQIDFPNTLPNLFIISPFKTVIKELKNKILNVFKNKLNIKDENILKNMESWLNNNLGTVHKFQGKEANEVIFILGCDKQTNNFAITNFINSNVVNVAATRAKYRLYIIGDYKTWRRNVHIKKAYKIIQNERKEN